ncbi:N(G),N(G)-dimethylarginine dimethylaminohydrolase 1 [Culicoides brevitarsis]|uniref:N(G),N(G)-dimethylarginine dimethylaminohydrolase 1 n=1 Tax=Culicoides brevitarsis TaxID=469753 RepID=UPI00307B1231
MKYTHALVSRIPLSLRTRGEIELEEAKSQHEAYVKLLRDLGLDVIELPPDEACPECAFVEDMAIVCNGIALITRPGDPNRQKEVETVRAVLKKELDLPLAEIADPNAKLDGGDVLFTGREFFVGLSKWTNEAGARAVAAAFPEYPCVPIKVAEHHHLKYYVSMAGPDLLCCSTSKDSQEILKRIEREATFNYQTLTLSEEKAANVLYINGTLVHRNVEEIPVSSTIIAEKIDIPRQSLHFSELGKFSTGLTACCILLKRTKHIRHL